MRSGLGVDAAALADEPDANLNLMPDDSATRSRNSVLSIFSFVESFSDPRHNPYDISRYIDRVSQRLSSRFKPQSFAPLFYFEPTRRPTGQTGTSNEVLYDTMLTWVFAWHRHR